MLSNKSVNCFVNAKCSSFNILRFLKKSLYHKQGRIQKGHVGSGHPSGRVLSLAVGSRHILEWRLVAFLSCISWSSGQITPLLAVVLLTYVDILTIT